MKKFLIGVICIIPIIVVLALNATSAIIAMTTPVNPTGMIVKNSSNVVLGKTDIVKVDSKDTEDFIIVEVLPTMTQDKTVTFERVDEVGEGELELERMGSTNRYRMIPKHVGVTQLVLRATANVNVYQTVTFNVTSDTIETVTLYNQDGDDLGAVYDVTSNERLFYDIYPMDALKDNGVLWQSTDENVVKVTQNGTLYPVSHGTARVKVFAKDKDGNTAVAEVDIDTTNAVAKQMETYSSSAVTIEWVKANLAVDAAHTEVARITDTEYSLKYTNPRTSAEITTVIKVYECEEGEWGFVDNLQTIYTANGPYFVELGYLEDVHHTINATLASSDTSIMDIEPTTGELLPQKAGKVTLSATYEDTTVSKEITVRERPIAFELTLNGADGKLGIQMSRCWGLYWLNADNSLTSTYAFGIEDDTNSFDVVWDVNNTEYAEIALRGDGTQGINITFKPESCGNSVTVTATLLINNRRMERFKRSFTFNMREEARSVNLYNHEQFKYISSGKEYQMVLQNDIVALERYECMRNLYGNGFSVDATQTLLEPYWMSSIRYTTYNDPSVVPADVTELLVEDIHIFNAPDLESSAGRAHGLRFEYFQIPVTARYVQIENCVKGLEFYRCKDATLEGSIMGDCRDMCVQVECEPESLRTSDEYPKLTIRNTVFKYSDYPSLMAVSDNGIFGENIMPHLYLEGFIDIYNWKKESELKDMFAKVILENVGVVGDAANLLQNSIGKVMNSFLVSPEFDKFFYASGGERYFSPGIMCLGTIFDTDISYLHNNASGVNGFVLPLRDESGKPLGSLGGIEVIITRVFPGAETITNKSVLVSNDFSQGEPEIKPGDPVPNSKSLYTKLLVD